MPDKPNILVIWGDDIGITNLSCYSDGLMGYRTPNIDRHRERGDAVHGRVRRAELHRRARRRSSPGRASFRTGLSKVGLPGARVGLAPEDPTIAELLKNARLRDGPVRQEPPRRPQRAPTDGARLRRVLRQPLPPERRGGAGAPRLSRQARAYPDFRERFGPRGVLRCRATTRTIRRSTRGGARRQAADPGHGPADTEADGDVRRRVRRRSVRLHRAPAQPAHAVLLLDQHDAHALPNPHEAPEPRARPAAGSRPTTTR